MGTIQGVATSTTISPTTPSDPTASPPSTTTGLHTRGQGRIVRGGSSGTSRPEHHLPNDSATHKHHPNTTCIPPKHTINQFPQHYEYRTPTTTHQPPTTTSPPHHPTTFPVLPHHQVRPDKVVCANAGDCRAVLARKEPGIGKRKRETVAAVPLSIDHNCRDPREQVALFKVNVTHFVCYLKNWVLFKKNKRIYKNQIRIKCFC